MADLPTREAILEWIADNPTLTSKRDIAKVICFRQPAGVDEVARCWRPRLCRVNPFGMMSQ